MKVSGLDPHRYYWLWLTGDDGERPEAAVVAPLASALNYVAGDLVTNMAAAGLDSSGRICISTYESADIVVDLAGVWK